MVITMISRCLPAEWVDSFMIPYRTPAILPWLYPSLTWRIPTERKELFLTFDDGPVNGPTEFVLEVLGRRNCKATFFCIGDNVRKHPDVFQLVKKGGHAIGNHTFNHLNGWKSDFLTYMDNVKLCDTEIKKNETSNSVKLFRPPYGRITRREIAALSVYKIIMWDVLTHDYNKSFSPDTILRKSIQATRNGSIIVFHDSLKAEKNMAAVLPKYVDHFLEQGFSFSIIPS
jgi:peptidoglycan/xylan/chitin deacetylase (PgdA/CDA1 family)